MSHRSIALATVALLALGAGCGSDDDDVTPPSTTVTYTAQLTGGAEVPPVTTSATGSATLTLTADRKLTINLTSSGYGSNVTMAHIHGPAAAGANAGIVLDLMSASPPLVAGGTTAAFNGTINLATAASPLLRVSADSLIAFMNSGRAYLNIHTATRGGGEIRGQIVRQ